MADDNEEPRRMVLKREVADRLRPVCAHFPEEEFDKMVEKIVEAHLRGETRLSKWGK